MSTRTTTKKTTAHSASQLQRALDFTPDQWSRVLANGLIPPTDMKTPRWSGPLVDELVARREQILAALPDDLNEQQLRDALGVDYGEWHRACQYGLIPSADRRAPGNRGAGFWAKASVDELIARAEHLRAAIPPPPIGARRSAEYLAERTGLEVLGQDVEHLARDGQLAAVDEFKGHDLYDPRELDALVDDESRMAALTTLVTDRAVWLADSIEPAAAARWLGWREDDLTRVAGERGIGLGRYGRYARIGIAALSADDELIDRVRRDQQLGPDQAATHMEIRRRDFDYVQAAGWVRPMRYVEQKVGVRKTVEVPLFTVGALEDAISETTEVFGVDWEAVRAAKPGQISPLREYTRLPIARATAIHAFCDQTRRRYGVEVWPHFRNARDEWEIDWELDENEQPTLSQVTADLATHPGAAPYRGQIQLSTEVGEVINWARRMLRPGAAAIVDTESTAIDGVIIEIAAIDAYDGQMLLNTLVDPAGEPISPGAFAVHHISDAELADAPQWAEVLPRFLEAVGDREILAYNAPFDRDKLERTHRHADLDVGLLPDHSRWGFLMRARSTWARVGRWMPLGGGHRALGDTQEARTVLQAIGETRASRRPRAVVREER
jgi:hypothetical protein